MPQLAVKGDRGGRGATGHVVGVDGDGIPLLKGQGVWGQQTVR